VGASSEPRHSRDTVELDPGNDNAKKLVEKLEKQKKAGKK
jgi:hypothetical protein